RCSQGSAPYQDRCTSHSNPSLDPDSPRQKALLVHGPTPVLVLRSLPKQRRDTLVAMQTAPIPADEEQRLSLLRACNIMYTPAEEAFDDVARLAADLCGTEIALITLVDSDRPWFKARVGVTLTETARDLSFCGHCITGRHPMVVEDTLLDPRFADNPLVVGDPGIRFYA